MSDYKYIIIGGGMTGDAAVRGIRQIDKESPIGLFSEEQHSPYNRPPLSKGLWKGMDENKIWRQTDSLTLDIHLDTSVNKIDPENSEIISRKGNSYSYKKLLLATGGTPIELPDTPDGIIYFRTYNDYQRLRKQVEDAKTITIIGGGFIGSELAAALTIQDKNVTMIFPEKGICGRIFPEGFSQYLNEYYEQKGINILADRYVETVTKNNQFTINTDHDEKITADVVVAGIGIEPNTRLAKEAGLKVDNGIVVNEYLQTSNSDIYAAGDVANFYNNDLDMRIRVEHEENANVQGMLAGINLTENSRPYDYLPYFYSDLFNHGYEAIGQTNPSMNIIEDWEEKYEKGVLYYLNKDRVMGVLIWNIYGQIDTARKIISDGTSIEPSELKGRISR